MNKTCRALAIAFIIATASLPASSQTLFTYGNHTADAKDFLRAFNKNNTNPGANKTKAMQEYLDLYIASRLKIQEAYDRGYDTLPQLKNDIEGLRSQIIENYLNDPLESERLYKEAFTRSQKDIHTGHIYISFRNKNGIIDNNEAEKLANEVYDKLKKGEDFGKLSAEYSSDSATRANKGDLGYITVFTLPYEFENIMYKTPAGKFTTPYKSKIGYHIFKNMGERKAIGKMKAAQILLAFPPGTDVAGKQRIAKLADSLYQRLLKGDNIATLASKFSNDYVSAASNGMMPDFGTGQYDAAFENAVFALAKDGDVTKPILTSHGYHIVKRMKLVPVSKDANNVLTKDDLRTRIQQSDRQQYARTMLLDRVIKKAYKKSAYQERELWAYTDSILDLKRLPFTVNLNRETPIFALGTDPANSAGDFINYARVFRYKSDGTGTKGYPQLMDEYLQRKAEDYYRFHLEEFNDEFKYQMNEFKDGNLFFEIMQREIWGKAQSDSAALLAYYEANKNRYHWKQSAAAVVLFCNDEASAKIIYDQMKKNPANWKSYSDALSERVVADSGRYEFDQIPNAAKIAPHAGLLTTPVKNKTDNSVSFAYVFKTFTANMPRSFTEAKGIVISDYQAELEKKWIQELKQKYPVKIDAAVWKDISK